MLRFERDGTDSPQAGFDYDETASETPPGTAGRTVRSDLAQIYFPIIGARCFFAAAGIVLRSVRIACARAEPHLQERSPSRVPTTSRMARCTFSAFLFK